MRTDGFPLDLSGAVVPYIGLILGGTVIGLGRAQRGLRREAARLARHGQDVRGQGVPGLAVKQATARVGTATLDLARADKY